MRRKEMKKRNLYFQEKGQEARLSEESDPSRLLPKKKPVNKETNDKCLKYDEERRGRKRPLRVRRKYYPMQKNE